MFLVKGGCSCVCMRMVCVYLCMCAYMYIIRVYIDVYVLCVRDVWYCVYEHMFIGM